jgi:hypothetical protein
VTPDIPPNAAASARVQQMFTGRQAGTISLAEFKKQVEALDTEELFLLSALISRHINVIRNSLSIFPEASGPTPY